MDNSYLTTKKAPIPHSGLFRRKKTIGVTQIGYGAEKLTYGIALKDYNFVKLFFPPLYYLSSIFKNHGYFWYNTPIIIDNSVALIHSMNQIPISTRPFVVSYESVIPRYFGCKNKSLINIGFKLLLSNNCRKILPMSEAARVYTELGFRKAGFPELSSKLRVFRGAVEKSRHKRHNYTHKGPIRLLFVGRKPFGKALVPVIQAVKYHYDHGGHVRLTIVSELTGSQNYIYRQFTPNAEEWRQKLSSLPFVEHIKSLPNDKTRRLMATHDLLLFPSLGESLGWVAVEAAMEGLPVFTTNIFALPELVVDNETGFIVKMDLMEDLRWVGLRYNNKELHNMLNSAEEKIRTSLISTLSDVENNREKLAQLGTAAKDRIEKLYSPEIAASHLKEIYEECI